MQSVLDRFRSVQRRLGNKDYRAMRRNVAAYKREKTRTVVTEFSTLSEMSVVFDVGGYQGNWAAEIINRYGCTVHVFEPHPQFASDIASRFAENDCVRVHPIALSSEDGRFALSNDQDASSGRNVGENAIECRMVSVDRFMAEHSIGSIDVMKVNIEGGEYDLLPALISGGHMQKIGTLLIQFHHFDDQDPTRRESIRRDLAQTHDCDWSYEFVWEQWSRKPGRQA